MFSSDQPPSQKVKNDVKDACAVYMYGHDVISCVANFTADVKSCAGESVLYQWNPTIRPPPYYDHLLITTSDHLF